MGCRRGDGYITNSVICVIYYMAVWEAYMRFNFKCKVCGQKLYHSPTTRTSQIYCAKHKPKIVNPLRTTEEEHKASRRATNKIAPIPLKAWGRSTLKTGSKVWMMR